MQPSLLHRGLRYGWRKFKLLRLLGALARDHLYDLRRYWRWSHGTDTERTRGQSLHALYKGYHGVEKGLSLAEPRPGFGRDKIVQLQARLRAHGGRYGAADLAPALAALHCYDRFGRANDVEDAPLSAFLGEFAPDDGSGGTRTVTRDEIARAVAGTGAGFFWSRHSLRNFAPEPVAMELMAEAVEMARKTPTVCNRQGVRAHVFERAEQALSHQPGNRGFGHLASRAVVVTADLQAFAGVGERNQPFIDGGMFAMSLLYAFHALGLGACPLAWSMPAAADRRMRAALDIPDSEAVIMMIAVGHLPERFEAARSHRLGLDHFMRVHPAPRA